MSRPAVALAAASAVRCLVRKEQYKQENKIMYFFEDQRGDADECKQRRLTPWQLVHVSAFQYNVSQCYSHAFFTPGKAMEPHALKHATTTWMAQKVH